MNRFNWTYLADNGTRHHVGLMHGPQSGHLLVYCNSKIILIDFKILENKTYSFFIEEELCELSIERKDDQFYYGFEPNIDADTPLNRSRKKRNRKDLYQSLAFIGALMIAVMIGTATMYYLNRDISQPTMVHQLSSMGKETHARILMEPDGKGKKIQYFFVVDGKPYTVETPFNDNESPVLLETGMPLEVGDEFIVRYLPGNPLLHDISFDRPSRGTLEAYKERAIATYREQYPEASKQTSNCLAEVAYKQKGIQGYAMMYFSQLSSAENKLFNEEAFESMRNDQHFLLAFNQQCK